MPAKDDADCLNMMPRVPASVSNLVTGQAEALAAHCLQKPNKFLITRVGMEKLCMHDSVCLCVCVCTHVHVFRVQRDGEVLATDRTWVVVLFAALQDKTQGLEKFCIGSAPVSIR